MVRKGSVSERILKMAARTEKNVRQRRGVVGGLVEVVSSAVRNGRDVVNRIDDAVQERGGYGAVADKAAERIRGGAERAVEYVANAADKAATSFQQYIEDRNAQVEKSLFTNGEFDREKAKTSLKSKAEIARTYGVKAADFLFKVVQGGANIAVKKYREYVPTQEERRTTYAGIGTEYEKNGSILLRQNFEACLEFAQKVDRKLPSNVLYRGTILKDIKASASQNKDELLVYYATLNNAASQRKLKSLAPYLKKI